MEKTNELIRQCKELSERIRRITEIVNQNNEELKRLLQEDQESAL